VRLLAFLRYLQHEGYAPNTIRRFYLPTIRRFYKINALEWPLKAWELPQVSERDVFAPALSAGIVRRLVDAALQDTVAPEDAALLALSTTYGLRRVEMTALRSEDIDPEHHLIHVRTAKGGRSRWHLIPQAIRAVLREGLPLGRSPRQVSKAFGRLEAAAGIQHIDETGWHAIRRALTRGLVEAGLPEPVIRNFLRWKRSADDMLLAYYSTTVVGEDGTHVDPGRQDRGVDEQVFARHPFLSLWEDA
ncbi:MAG: tyrosine-type recombinase/integrase, partial [Dehalococcoidia bacterium]